jgi:hypothetical protein
MIIGGERFAAGKLKTSLGLDRTIVENLINSYKSSL